MLKRKLPAYAASCASEAPNPLPETKNDKLHTPCRETRKKAFQAHSERIEQERLFAWWRAYRVKLTREKGLAPLMWHTPNGGARSIVTAAMMKKQGVLPGVPDIFLAWPSSGRHGLFIEMKRASGGRVSEAQKNVMAFLENAGYRCAVCRGFSEAVQCIRSYLEGFCEEAGSDCVQKSVPEEQIPGGRDDR